MVRPLPRQPSLEQLKRQAKDLLAAYRRGDADARARLARWFAAAAETGATAQPLRLAQAQLAIAPSWRRAIRSPTCGGWPCTRCCASAASQRP